MYKKNLAYRAGVIMLAGALAFSNPILAFADMNIATEESSKSAVFNICYQNQDTGMSEYSPVKYLQR